MQDGLPENAKNATVNSDYHTRVQQWMEVIESQPILGELFRSSSQPLTINEGAKLEPFNEASLKTAVQPYSVVDKPVE
eukprot:3564778-Pyramimonas_sp.AAC.1